jgi:hypothetical protein
MLLLLPVLLASCSTDTSTQPTATDGPSSASLLIAPFLHGEYFCDDALVSPDVVTEDDAAFFCAAEGKNAADAIDATLTAVGPASSPSGHYRLGYTLEIPAFRYFRKINGRWIFDQASLLANLTTITDVGRQVVVYISADHFVDSNLPLAAELASDQSNLMWTRDGPVEPDPYFLNPVVAWTLDNDAAPVNTMRDTAFRSIVGALCQLPADSQAKIVAVSVLGETHQMIPDLVAGPGLHVPMYEATDYSPMAVSEFRSWLSQRFVSIEALNRAVGGEFATFESISPPSKDFHTEPVASYFDHIDDAAAGTVTVSGWVYDSYGRALSVAIYIDGQFAGNARMGLNRTDVTATNPAIINPNVGFEQKLDYRSLVPGTHLLQVLIETGTGIGYEFARQNLIVMSADNRAAAPIPYRATAAVPPGGDSGLSGGLDGPAANESVLYNPMALLWLEFRNLVVRSYLTKYAQIVVDSCIPKSKVFSHQIAPSLYGGWNADLLAAETSKELNDAYTQGTTLYGGTAFGEAFLVMKRRLHWTRYSVSEMHPLVALTPPQYLAMFEMHRNNGAVFVAPYYMATIPPTGNPALDLSRFLIAPDNPTYASNLYYQAIQSVMAQ